MAYHAARAYAPNRKRNEVGKWGRSDFSLRVRVLPSGTSRRVAGLDSSVIAQPSPFAYASPPPRLISTQLHPPVSDGTFASPFMPDIRVLEYLDPQARSPFATVDGLNAVASAKVTAALYQFAAGNWSNVNGVGAGVFERKIDVGPGCWIYLGKDGDRLVILLGGSTKQHQQQAIETAQERWVTIAVARSKRSCNIERRYYGAHEGIQEHGCGTGSEAIDFAKPSSPRRSMPISRAIPQWAKQSLGISSTLPSGLKR